MRYFIGGICLGVAVLGPMSALIIEQLRADKEALVQAVDAQFDEVGTWQARYNGCRRDLLRKEIEDGFMEEQRRGAIY